MLARAGIPVTLIGRARHVDAIGARGLILESATFSGTVHPDASTDAAAVKDADAVLLCVKSFDTEEAAGALAPHLAPGAQLFSLQNGVDNVERIKAASGIDALPVVVYVGVRMPEPGKVRHTGGGDLILPSAPQRVAVDNLAAALARAGVPCRISDEIEGELWMKLVLNCAWNAMSAVTQANYGKLAGTPETRALLVRIVEETLAVASAAHIRLPVPNPVDRVLGLAWPI
jgi:2-dehydropantoate 2-reductase